MADSDLALAMAIAENSSSSQDEDFQLSSHAGQLFILNKLACSHTSKRQKKVHLSNKKVLSDKPERVSKAGKENQKQSGRRDESKASKGNFANPDLSQMRRPLESMKNNVRNGTREVHPENVADKESRKQNTKDKSFVVSLCKVADKNQKHSFISEQSSKQASVTLTGSHSLTVDDASVSSSRPPPLEHHHKQASVTLTGSQSLAADGASISSSRPPSHEHHQKEARVILTGSHSLAVDGDFISSSRQSSHDHHHKQEGVTLIGSQKLSAEEIAFGVLKSTQHLPKEDALNICLKAQNWQHEEAGKTQRLSPRPSPITVYIPHHHPACKDGDFLLDNSEGDATFASMEEIVSLAEDDLEIDIIKQKQQQQLKPECIQTGKLPTDECLPSANVNPESQFSALLQLCIDAVSDDDEDKEPQDDSLFDSFAVEAGSFKVEEAITSLMTQTRCRKPVVSHHVCLSHDGAEVSTPEISQKSHDDNTSTLLVTLSQKTCLEAQIPPFEAQQLACEEADFGALAQRGGTQLCAEPNLEQPESFLECPVCGSCITGLSLEQREVHTNACLDSLSKRESGSTNIDNDQARFDCKNELGECVQEDCSLDLTSVLKWLETLNLSRYASFFVREEIDWDTLKCLTDEDLSTLGITALGPRRKILHAIQQMEKGSCENATNTTIQGVESNQQVEADTTGRKLITDFFELPPSLQRKSAPGPATEPSTKLGGPGVFATRKRILTDLGGIPEWMSIPGTKFRVDAFQHLRADCSHWFLTHFHTDHYQGLTRGFRYGHVYCSPITAQLVNTRIGVPWERLKSLPLNERIDIDGVIVTLMDANHCPGSVMILFEPQNGKAVLHTGDFRFCEDMANSSVLQACNIHTLMLDTTYCNPQYDFPKQEVVIQFIIDAIQAEAFNPSTLFLIGTYTIGKERIFFEVAKVLQKKIYCSTTKLRLLQCMNFPDEDMRWLTTNDRDAHIHVVPLWSIASFKRMSYISRHNHGRYNSIVSFSPTGWSFGRGKKRTPGRRWQQGTVVRYEVPYSEHCSFKELKDFVRFINPVNIVPSVHNDSAEAADTLIALLLNEEDE